jgi:hypothetical protein
MKWKLKLGHTILGHGEMVNTNEWDRDPDDGTTIEMPRRIGMESNQVTTQNISFVWYESTKWCSNKNHALLLQATLLLKWKEKHMRVMVTYQVGKPKTI